jgi:hypothetical protein
MKFFFALLISLVAISLFTSPVFCCEHSCSRCSDGSLTIAGYGPVTITSVPKAVIHAGKSAIRHTILELKVGIKTVSNLPGFAVKKVIDNSGDARVAFENAAYKTQITFATISAKVTSLSVYLFRSVFSTFWGLLLGLLR